MGDLAGLIERLERLDGPDREVDARIAVALGDVIMRGNVDRGFAFFRAPLEKGDWAFLSGCKNGENDAYRALGQCLNIKHYTASLDAAVALVERCLPGAYREMTGPRRYLNIPTPVPARFRAEILHDNGTAVRWHDREPIALLLALLRAMQKEER